MRASRRVLLVAALLVSLLATAFSSGAAAGTLFVDGFESGTTSAWTTSKGADGTVVVQQELVRTDAYAARLAATSTSGSYAFLRRDLSSTETSVTAQAAVRVQAEGASGSNVPLLRLLDEGGGRLVNVYRQNLSSDKIYVQHSGAYHLSTGRLPLGMWTDVSIRIVAGAPNASTVEVRLGGTIVHATNTANLSSGAKSVQVGNDARAQAFDLVVDDVVVSAEEQEPPADSEPDTVIDQGPSGTVATGDASFSFSSTQQDAIFECTLDGEPWEVCTSPTDYSGLTDGEHGFQVRAISVGGTADSTPAARTWTVAMATDSSGTCDTAAPDPTTSDPGDVVVADDFEDAPLSKWTSVVQQGDGTVDVLPDVYKAGRCAVRVVVTDQTWDSRANLSKTLPAGTKDVWADGWFYVQSEGEAGWNVPTFRMLTNGKRVVDVSRENGNGNVFVRFPKPGGGWSYIQTGRRMDLGKWYRVKVHVVAEGDLSTVEVWLDGTRYISTSTATLGVNSLDVAMVGAEHQNQVGVFYADDAVVKAVAPPPPSDTLISDGFEKGLGGWTTSKSGDGLAEAQTSVVKAGTYAARLASSTSGSAAHLRRSLSSSETDLAAVAHVNVRKEGASGAGVPLMTLIEAGGTPLVTLSRANQSGTLTVRHSGANHVLTAAVPLSTWSSLSVRAAALGTGKSVVEVLLNGALVHSTTTASLGTSGVRTVQLGAASGPFDVVFDEVTATKGAGGLVNDPRYKLLIADSLNRRLVITDFDGKVVWRFDNPTGNTDYSAGPLGVRWLPGDKILATFGTGEVGVIDVATKTWDWRTKGYNGDWFRSPYDAELLPDGRLAVALRRNDGGRISVYDRSSGKEVWRHLLGNAHAVHYRSAAQSYASDEPTLLVGGWGSVREITYNGTASQSVTWQLKTEYTHDVIAVEDDRLLTTEGYYIQKVDRAGKQMWRRSTPDENRRIAVNPNTQGGYVYTVAESDRIEFRDANGHLLRDWSRLSDDTVLDYPYGIAVIDYPG